MRSRSSSGSSSAVGISVVGVEVRSTEKGCLRSCIEVFFVVSVQKHLAGGTPGAMACVEVDTGSLPVL